MCTMFFIKPKLLVIICLAHVNNGLFKSLKSSRIKWKGWVKCDNIYVTLLRFSPNELNFVKMILKMVLLKRYRIPKKRQCATLGTNNLTWRISLFINAEMNFASCRASFDTKAKLLTLH